MTVPAALGLNKLVKAHLALEAGKPRTHGIHPSSMTDFCPVQYWYLHQTRLTIATSDDPIAIVTAFETLRKHSNLNLHRYSTGVQYEFPFGDFLHIMVQYNYGLIGVLWGEWQCAFCRIRTPEGFMPRVMRPDINGAPLPYPAPCQSCDGKNVFSHYPWSDYPWLYVEPEIKLSAWQVLGHVDGDIRVCINGVWHYFILEIKSAHKEKFGGRLVALPERTHVVQASMYAWVKGYTHILFVYVNKDQPNQTKEFISPLCAETIETVKKKIATAVAALDLPQPPLHARVCASDQVKQADGCVFRGPCFAPRAV